jgi:hypothetical protein
MSVSNTLSPSAHDSALGSALPMGVFRICFFLGVGLHFGPALVHWRSTFASHAYRVDQLNSYVHHIFSDSPDVLILVMASALLISCFTGALGICLKASSACVLLGTYAFASMNLLKISTLALYSIWAIAPVLMVTENGSALSVWTLLGKPAAASPQTGRRVILWQTLVALFFSGVEKLMAGWPAENGFQIILRYPPGFVTRTWILSVAGGNLEFAAAASTLTVVLELSIPAAFLFARARLLACIMYAALFIGIVATLEIPPLFVFIYLPIAMLGLDDGYVMRISATARRVFNWCRWGLFTYSRCCASPSGVTSGANSRPS